jgi:formylglycine-generating enzyme required for sulfatase activity
VAPPPADGSRSWIGWAVLAAIAAVVAAVLIYARSQPPAGASAPPAPDAAAARGFRADAWFLPDDPLLGFVEIPAGPFVMGSDPSKDPQAFDNERWPGARPQATLDLPGFYIGRHEVTAAQYGAFVAATGHKTDPQALARPANHPIAFVTWPDALAYCRWLESVLRDSPAAPAPLRDRLRDGWHVVLPSEAQWEKAARGTDGRIYPWGDGPRRDRANYGGAAPMAVGSFACPECPFPLFDMSGNVWEWTLSPLQPYPFDPSDDRQNLEADALWVMRGGSFADNERNIRAATRGGADPGVRRAFIGFRVALVKAEG